MRKFWILIILVFGLTLLGFRNTSVYAQTDNLAGTYGTEFWLGFLRNNAVEPDDPTVKITVFAVAEDKVDIVIALGSSPNSALKTISIPAGGGFGSAELIPSAVYPTKDEAQSPTKKGVILFAKDGKTKFSCYALIEAGKDNGSTRDATLLLPKDVLDKEYFVQTYSTDTKSTEFVVVATEDNTKVNIKPTCATSKSAAGTDLSVTLSKGQAYLVQSAAPGVDQANGMDLSGSTICADNPIAVFTGNEVTKIATGNTGAYSANHTFEQLIPQTMWGTEFYVGRAGGIIRSFVQVTASYDNTDVTYIRPSGTTTVTLNRGQSLPNLIQFNDANQNVVIKATMPVLCYTYLGCGANNQSSGTDPVTGDDVTYDWGNPANALVVPWSHRAKEMSFYTSEIENETDAALQHYYVQIVTATADISKITLDAAGVPSTSFQAFVGDNSMSVANVELTTHGKHKITSTGSGFMGFVHGITSEARAYQYTLGFDPPKYLDSLFIENEENWMSPFSYELPRMEDHGWLQRQIVDWPVDQQRLDTAYVCDSTILDFFGQLAEQNKADSVVWKIYKCDDSGKKQGNPIESYQSPTAERGTISRKYEYQFIMDDQRNMPPEKRKQFQYFAVDMEKYKNHLICTDLPPDVDTLRTMVRVHRQYNDTTWRVVCEIDTVHFFEANERFEQNLTGGGKNDMTVFQFNTDDQTGSKNIVKFVKGGLNTYSRKYKTINGCDSIVTLRIFGCDTLYHMLDTTICEIGFEALKDSLQKKLDRFKKTGAGFSGFKIKSQEELLQMIKDEGKLSPYTEIYKDGRNSMSCLQADPSMTEAERKAITEFVIHCPDFKGCPDTFELRLTIAPLLYYPAKYPDRTEWCTLGDNTLKYTDWTRADGSWIRDIEQTESKFVDDVGFFTDTLKWNCADFPNGKCPTGTCAKEIDAIELHIAKDTTLIKHICQNESYYHRFGGGKNGSFNGWDPKYKDLLYDPANPQPAVDSLVFVSKGDCNFQSRLVLYIHPVYVNDEGKNIHTEQQFNDTICVTRASNEYYAVNTPDHWEVKSDSVWSVYDNKKIHRDSIHYNKASARFNGDKPFEYIEQLKTKACKECNENFGCDSIRRFFLYVPDTFHVEDPFELCDNGELEYVYNNQHYYFYSERYKGTKKSPYEIINDANINEKCGDQNYFYKNFTGVTQYGCDSIRTLKVHLKETYTSEIDTFVCVSEGVYHFVNGKDYVLELGRNPLDTLELSTILQPCGCDSGVIHHVHIAPSPNITENDTLTCQWMKGATSKEFFVWKNHEADRMITMVNTANQYKKKVKASEIPLDSAGNFTLIDSLKTLTCPDCDGRKGCDSIHTRKLQIIPTWNDTTTKTMSDESYEIWDGTIYAGPHAELPEGSTLPVVYPNGYECFTKYYKTTVDAFEKPVPTESDCDSLYTYCFRIGKTYHDTVYAPVCENCDFYWRDHINDDGTTTPIIISGEDVKNAPNGKLLVEDKYLTVLGFDSVYAIELTAFPTKRFTESKDTCQGEIMDWDNHMGAKNRLYIVDPATDIATPISKNDFRNTITKNDGVYLIRDSLKTDTVFYNKRTDTYEPVSCDSIWELTLTVHPTYIEKYHKVRTDQSLCSDETLLWSNRLWVGYDYDLVAHPLVEASNTTEYDSIIYIPKSANRLFQDSIVTDGTQSRGTLMYGCDSIHYIDIHISRYDTTWVINHIGDNDSTWSFGGKGGRFNYKGKRRITREDLVRSDTTQYDDPTRWEIKQFFFIDTLTNMANCDSIVWDSVYIHPTYRFQFDTVVCSNASWSWRSEESPGKFDDMNYRKAGYYYDSLQTTASLPYKFDSVYVLKLGIEPGADLEFHRNQCKNDTTWWEKKRIYYQDDFTSIRVTFSTAHCDSVLTMYPHFYEYYHFTPETIAGGSICRYDTITWISPGETTPHTKALRGEKGEHFDYLPTDTLGWITVYDSLISSAPCKCDSTYTLRYFVKPAYRFYDTLTICSNDTLIWHDQTLHFDSASVQHTHDSYITCGGLCDCDSVYYLTLYVNQSYDSIAYDTICGNIGNFEWQGHKMDSWLKYHLEDLKDTLPIDTFLYTRYDTKYHRFPSEEECDSVFQLYLNVRPIVTEEWYDTICIGETYSLNSKQFTTSGTYMDTIQTVHFKCDSIAKVHLAVVPATYFKVDPQIVCADKGGYDMIFTFNTDKGYPPREVRVVYDSLAQACGFPTDTVYLPVTGDHVEMALPLTDELYVRPNHYSARLFFDNGTCDDLEMQKADFHFTVNYPDWIMEQHWSDAIGLLSEKYNGGYTFSSYQWYKNGELLVGETKPYYYTPNYLETGAEYTVELTRVNDDFSLFACAITATKRDSTVTPKKPYVSVVPTYVVKDNPIVHILCSQYGGEYKILNPYGSLIQSGHFTPGGHNSYEVRLPALSGIYMFELIQENGEHRTVKVIVN